MNSIDRRGFIKSSALLLAATAAPLGGGLSALAQDAPKKRALKKAVHLGMIGGSAKTVMDKFKLAKDLGFEGLEVNGPNDPQKAEIINASEATGVAIADVMNSVHWKDTLSDADPAVRARGLEGLKGCLQDAKDFHCETVLLVPAVVNKSVSYADAYTRSVAEIRKAVPLAEKLGVKIDIENVWNQFLLSPLEAARYVDEFKSPAVAWHFDVGNIVNYGFPEQWIRTLGKRIGNVHFKEYSRKRRDNEGLWKGFEVELMEGDCDWPAVMKAFDEVGYKGWVISEIGGGGETRLKQIAELMDKIIAC